MHETRTLSTWRTLVGRLTACLLLSSAAAFASCREKHETTDGNEPSPNASILPSPLASQRPSPLADAGKPASGDADGGTPDAQAPISPVYFALDGPVASDIASPRDSLALTAKAAFSWVPRPSGGGASRPGLFPLKLAFAYGRMRLIVDSEFLPLPTGTEFRSRVDRYGHLLVWPGLGSYRVLAPGTLRGLLEERRADVGPLLDATVDELGKGRLLGVVTRRDSVKSPMGALTLEQARLAGVGNAGQLLCRFLLELILVKPDSPACLADHLPLKAEYAWEGGGQLSFAVSLVTDKVEIQPGDFATPPRRSSFRERELPNAPEPLLVGETKLAELTPDPKAKPIEQQPIGPPPKVADTRGLLLKNQRESPRFLLINDALVAWVPPHSELSIERLKPGAYSLTSRDFLGTEPIERWAQKVPGRRVMGAEKEDKGPPGSAQ